MMGKPRQAGILSGTEALAERGLGGHGIFPYEPSLSSKFRISENIPSFGGRRREG